jgi:hypothetical protein
VVAAAAALDPSFVPYLSSTAAPQRRKEAVQWWSNTIGFGLKIEQIRSAARSNIVHLVDPDKPSVIQLAPAVATPPS